MAQQAKLNALIEPVVSTMDFEFVGLEYLAGASPAILRVYIDHPDGINVDDCALVSRQISAILDVEDPISGEYNLEVSSPGLNRPLFKAEHYQQCLGEKVKLKMRFPVKGQRNYTGQLQGVNDAEIELAVDNNVVVLSIADIERANMVFDHNR